MKLTDVPPILYIVGAIGFLLNHGHHGAIMGASAS